MKKISLLIRLYVFILLNNLLVACATYTLDHEEIKPKDPVPVTKHEQDKKKSSENEQTKNEPMQEQVAEKAPTKENELNKSDNFTKPVSTEAIRTNKKSEHKINSLDNQKAKANLSEQEMNKQKYTIDTPKKDPSLGEGDKNNKSSRASHLKSPKNSESSTAETKRKEPSKNSSSTIDKQNTSSIEKKKSDKKGESNKPSNSTKLSSNNKKERLGHEQNLLKKERHLSEVQSSIGEKTELDKQRKTEGIELKDQKGGYYGEDGIFYGVDNPILIYEEGKKKPPAKTRWNLQRQL